MNKTNHWFYSAGLNNSSLSARDSEHLKKPSFNPLTQFELGKRSGEAVKGLSRAAQKPTAKGKDKKAPKATLSLLGSVTGGSTYDFLVTYKDNKGIKAGSLGTGDILVTGNGGVRQVATFVSKSLSKKGKVYNVIYQMAAPGGTWDAVDNGAYSISLQARQVKDISRNFAIGKNLGSFPVAIPTDPVIVKPPVVKTPVVDSSDKIAPTASLSATNLFTGSSSTYDFTITYADNSAIDAGSIDSNDITVVDRSGSIQQVEQVEKVAVNGSGASYTATYRVKAPGGTWNKADNGSYDVVMQPNQVRDINGNAVTGSTLGSLSVDVLLRSIVPSQSSNSDLLAKDFVLDVDTSTGIVQDFEFNIGDRRDTSGVFHRLKFDPAAIQVASSFQDLISRNKDSSYPLGNAEYSFANSNLLYFVKFNSYHASPPDGNSPWNYSSNVLVFGVKTSSNGSALSLLETALNGTSSTTVIDHVRFAGNSESFPIENLS